MSTTHELKDFRLQCRWDKAVADLEKWALRQGLPLGDKQVAPRRRRRKTRYDVFQKVRFGTLAPSQTTDGYLVQISHDALVIQSTRKLEPGTAVACGLYLGRSGSKELVLVKGKVIRILDESSGFVMSVDDATINRAHLVANLVGLVVIEPMSRQRGARKVA